MTDVLDPKCKHCINCKYHSPQDYDDAECKSPTLIKMERDDYGRLCKVHPYSKDVLTYEGTARNGRYKPCPYFKSGFWFTVRQKYSKIQEAYYKKRHPEWFL